MRARLRVERVPHAREGGSDARRRAGGAFRCGRGGFGVDGSSRFGLDGGEWRAGDDGERGEIERGPRAETLDEPSLVQQRGRRAGRQTTRQRERGEGLAEPGLRRGGGHEHEVRDEVGAHLGARRSHHARAVKTGEITPQALRLVGYAPLPARAGDEREHETSKRAIFRGGRTRRHAARRVASPASEE